MNSRGQVEAEAVISIILLLFFFVVIATVSFARQSEAGFFERKAASLEECYRIQKTIDFFSFEEGIDEIYFDVSRDFNVGEKTIYVGEFFCSFFGNAQESSLSAGTIRIFDENNLVGFENA